MGSPPDKVPRSRLRALRDLLLGARPEPLDGTLGDDDPTTPASSRIAAPRPDPGLPARIGPYPVLRKLGQGGMGVVYAARDEKLGRPVAIKTISGGGADETATKRFWREARAAASVNHPNVCQLVKLLDSASRDRARASRP